MRYLCVLIGLVVGCLTFSEAMRAHEVRPAYLRIEATAQQPASESIAESYDVLWKHPLNQEGARLTPVFPKHCTEIPLALDEIVGPLVTRQLRLECSEELMGSELSIAGLELTITEVMVHVTLGDGDTSTYILKPTNPSVVIEARGISVWSYLLLGFEHLLFGIDHILFVIALMFFVSRISALIKTITAFTVAHSITLALSALEWVYVPQEPVEAVIAVSILFLATERLREEGDCPNPDSMVRNQTWVVAFVFGLLHGFGFAGALADIGLPKGNLLGALFLFNVGVELGQLLIIAFGLCVIWITRRVWVTAPQYVVRAPLYVVGIAAAYWVIERTVGILS